jgi:hypothetical protein
LIQLIDTCSRVAFSHFASDLPLRFSQAAASVCAQHSLLCHTKRLRNQPRKQRREEKKERGKERERKEEQQLITTAPYTMDYEWESGLSGSEEEEEEEDLSLLSNAELQKRFARGDFKNKSIVNLNQLTAKTLRRVVPENKVVSGV